MKKYTLFLLSLVLISCQNSLEISAQESDFETELTNEIIKWTQSEIHYGVNASVILADGTEWIGSAGKETENSELKTESLIWIASITKSMTGAVVMKLAEEGKLSLDDKLGKWLPEMENISPDITIRQLLNHSNGLENYTKNQELWAKANQDPQHVFQSMELMGYVGSPVFDPGARTQYTNTSFVLLGMIAESVTGRLMVDLYHEKIWRPLNLTEIFLPGHEAPPFPVAGSWLVNRQEQRSVAPLDVLGTISTGNYAFGLFSNARTISRWGRELFHGEFLSDEMKAQMVTFLPAAGNIPGESGVGLGIRQYNFLDREQWGHSGGSPLGSSLMIYDPETGITVTAIMNQGGGAGHFLLVPKLLEISSKYN